MNETTLQWALNPVKIAEQRRLLNRRFEVKKLTRLLPMLASNIGYVEVALEGRVDEDRRRLIGCEMKGEVMLECHTTFRPVTHRVEHQVTFYPVFSEQAVAAAPEEYEAFVVDGEDQDLVQLIEDELILSLPLAVSSDDAPESLSFGPKIEADATDKPNPFAVLKGLKTDN